MASPNADWQRIREIFERVVDQEDDDRAVLLANLCGQDDVLREEVEALLAADIAADGGFLDQPVVRRTSPESRSGSPSDPASRETAEELPSRIGPYEVEGELGRGGMGVVYLARDPVLDRRVALKCLTPELAADGVAVERLEREARTLAALVHANVATLYGFEKHASSRYLVLEYVAGESLADRLKTGPLSLVEALRLGAQIAAGLAAAHEKGIVHRDLKPANVRLSPDGSAKVLDFGLAKPAALPQGADGLTHTGAVVGTVAYMSPEQARGQNLDRRGDVWAFGCVLWECLTGQRAFRGKTPWQTLDAIIRRPPDWDELPEDLPPRLERLLRRCLRKEPEERARDLADVRLEILDLLNEVREGSTESFQALAFQDAPKRRRWRAIVPALLGAVVATVSLGILWWRGVFPPAPGTEPNTDTTVEETTYLSVELDETNLAAEFSGLPIYTISPDGRDVVYRGFNKLLKRSFSSQGFQFLQEAGDIASPFYSPDSGWIGFFHRNNNARTDARFLFKMKPTGSHPVQISDRALVGVGASWGDDGTIVFAPAWQSSLWEIDADGTAPATELTRLNTERNEVSHRWPHVLPGSHAVLFTVKTPDILLFDEAHIQVFDRRTGDTKVLVEAGTAPSYTPSGHLLWGHGHALHAAPFDPIRLELTGPPVQVVDGVRVNPITGAAYYSVSQNGRLTYLEPVPARKSHIVEVDANGEMEILLEGDLYQQDVRISPDGRYLVYQVIAANNSLWIYDRERGINRRIPHGLGNSLSPLWTPDGQHVLFVAERENGQQIVRLPIDGHGSPEVLWRDDHLHLCDVGADGGVVFLKITTETRADLWYLPSSGESARPIVNSRAGEACGRLSPDGRYLIYTVAERGSMNVFLRSFPEPGTRLQISTDRGASPRWSLDGSEVIFNGIGGWFAMKLLPGPRAGPVRQLLPSQFPLRNLELDRDGYVAMRQDHSERMRDSKLHVVLNWFDELHRQAGEPP